MTKGSEFDNKDAVYLAHVFIWRGFEAHSQGTPSGRP